MKNDAICKGCGFNFWYENKEAYFNDKGYGYSTKLIKCPSCGRPVILGYYEDRSMKLNNDSRYYDYKNKTFIK